MKKVALLIDGGYLRESCKRTGNRYVPDYIEKVAHACVGTGEELFRVLYYDCPLFEGQVRQPVSSGHHKFTANNGWLRDLARRDFFAVRLGKLKFRGWTPKAPLAAGHAPTDADFKAEFEQKGVDMRIGLDIATLSSNRAVDRVLLVTADTDFIPAMKHARVAGLQVVGIEMAGTQLSAEFVEHLDLKRAVAWPPP